jgi:AraC-like DNA-binding protein
MKTRGFSNETTDRKLKQLQSELVTLIAGFTDHDGEHSTAISPLVLYRYSMPAELTHGLYTPALGIVAQGRKALTLAGERYVYGQGNYLFISVDLPAAGQVIEATPDAPYLGLRLNLDLGQIGGLMMEAGLPKPRSVDVGRGMMVGTIGAPLLEAVVRLLRLLESPEDIGMLAPLTVREILYRLLVGEQGAHLRQMTLANSRTQRVTKAIGWLKHHFAERLRLEALAHEVNMSPSGFHHYFKSVTALTPLQYQKHLRLQEARRLMLSEDLDAATAGFQVGYESPSQFSREYRRLFGAPPLRDITRLRNLA